MQRRVLPHAAAVSVLDLPVVAGLVLVSVSAVAVASAAFSWESAGCRQRCECLRDAVGRFPSCETVFYLSDFGFYVAVMYCGTDEVRKGCEG